MAIAHESAGAEPALSVPRKSELSSPGSATSGTGRILLLLRVWWDLPALARHSGHLVLFSLLALIVLRYLPAELPVPTLSLWVDAAPAEGSSYEEPSPNLPPSRPATYQFLQRAAVPFTLRSQRSGLALPVAEPAQTVRTSVTLYRVQEGDTVLGIAVQFDLEGNSLLWANPKLADNPDFLTLGQELVILPIDGAYHLVTAGETVEEIAKQYKVEPRAIVDYPGNHLTSEAKLEPGVQLIVPGGIKPYVPRRVFAYSGEVPKNAQKGSGKFVWPLSGYITQRYWNGHRAIDIGGGKGTPIMAADSGYVAVAQWSDVGYGRMIIIDHGNGSQTLYAHLDAYFVEVGQSVGKGEVIGHCGSTGNATGPHLHFEIIQRGVRRNPFMLLP